MKTQWKMQKEIIISELRVSIISFHAIRQYHDHHHITSHHFHPIFFCQQKEMQMQIMDGWKVPRIIIRCFFSLSIFTSKYYCRNSKKRQARAFHYNFFMSPTLLWKYKTSRQAYFSSKYTYNDGEGINSSAVQKKAIAFAQSIEKNVELSLSL